MVKVRVSYDPIGTYMREERRCEGKESILLISFLIFIKVCYDTFSFGLKTTLTNWLKLSVCKDL